MNPLRYLNNLLQNDDGITQGGEKLNKWVLELIESFLIDREQEFIAIGGIIVPQYGESSGIPSFFIKSNVPEENIISSIERIQEIWRIFQIDQSRASDEFKIKNLLKEEYKCYLASLNQGLDSSIGVIYIISNSPNEVKLRESVMFLSTLLTTVIINYKANTALDYIAQPIWEDLDTADELFEYAVGICFEAVSCHGVAIWELENDYLRTKLFKIRESEKELNLDMRLGEGIAGKCAKENKQIIIDDLYKENVKHLDAIKKNYLQSGIFLPIRAFGKSKGVFAVYGNRSYAFTRLDINIICSIIQWLNIKVSHDEWVQELKTIKDKVDLEMPLIETGILAMGNIHDAKNQLNFAQGELSYLTTKYNSKPGSEIYIRSNNTSNYISEAQKIISELVKRSKIESKNLKNASINNLISKEINKVKPILDEKKIILRFNYKNDYHPKIDVDLIKRVFQNLFDNSIHFLQDVSRKREILIDTTNSSHNKLIIIFKDNGEGIYKPNLKDIFNVFYTSKGEKGMGFGLPIVKKIINNHGGQIFAESDWGEYTKFIIEMPLK